MRAPVIRLTGSLVGSILFLNYLPFAATYGLACIPMYAAVGALFFLPVLAVASDLTARFPDGGIQCWVTEAFGRRFGLFAVYVQWLVSITFQPAALSYSATAAALAFDPALALSRHYAVSVTVTGTWVLTAVACVGYRGTAWITTLCVALGVLLPLFVVVGITGHRVQEGQIALSAPSLGDLALNSTSFSELKHLTGMVFQFGGAELYAVYAQELPSPASDYTAAMRAAAAVVFLLYLAGSLVIALVAPPSLLAPHATLLEVLPVMGLATITQPMACLAAVGGIGMALAWVLPPATGLCRALRQVQLLPALQSMTTLGVPLPILLLQAFLITILCGLFLLEDVGATFWVFTAVSAQLQLIMYITMFLAALRIESRAMGPRPLFSYFAATIGLLTSAATLCLGFAPPKTVNLQVGWHATLMSLAVIVVSAVPLALPDRRRAMSSAGQLKYNATDRADSGGRSSPLAHDGSATSPGRPSGTSPRDMPHVQAPEQPV